MLNFSARQHHVISKGAFLSASAMIGLKAMMVLSAATINSIAFVNAKPFINDSNSWANAQATLQSIDAIAISHACGNRVANIEAVYNGKKIAILLAYDGSTKVFKNGRVIDDQAYGAPVPWWSFFCPSGKEPRRGEGSYIRVTGRWANGNFYATRVYY